MTSTTVVYPEMRELATEFDNCYKSAVCSGIAGDRRHTSGYHKGRKAVGRSDYSVVRPDDRPGQGPDDAACAIDMTMGRKDMILCTQRLASAYHNVADPRRKYINAFNGWTGQGAATRYDFYARKTKQATADHKWHIHLEKRRRYARDRVANAAILSLLRGESVSTWLKSRGITTSPGPSATAPTARKAAVLKAPPYPGRVLRRNDKLTKPDPAVQQFQQRMRDRGWTSIGPADGKPGAKFEKVVRGWQKTCKLPVDGTVGPKTWPTPWTRPLGG